MLPLVPLIAMIPMVGNKEGGPALVYFALCLGVSWIMTRLICRPMVTCPFCGVSLWECGTGNFKPRRMKIRKGVSACPHCRVPIC